jgi:hypothetical protein
MMDAAADLETAFAALRTIVDELAEAPPGSLRRMPLKDAAFVVGISETRMRRRCEENVYGVVVGGYGYKRRGRWEVVLAPFVIGLPVSALRRVNTINRSRLRD